MKQANSPYIGVSRSVAGLVTIFFAQYVLAECIVDPGAGTVFSIDANQGCDNIAGHEGCSINNAIGSCSTTIGGQTLSVTSTLGANGQAEWTVDAGSDLGIDVAVINGGAQGKNNCSYMYDSDAFEGIGGDLKSNGEVQNITGAFFCSDGQQDSAPPVAEPLPQCGTLESGEPLDNTGIQCGTDRAIVCNFEIDEPSFGANDGSCCVCNISEIDQCLEGDLDCPIENGVRVGEIIDVLGLPSPGAWRDARGVWHFY